MWFFSGENKDLDSRPWIRVGTSKKLVLDLFSKLEENRKKTERDRKRDRFCVCVCVRKQELRCWDFHMFFL